MAAGPDAGRVPGDRGRQRIHRRLGRRSPPRTARAVVHGARSAGSARPCTPGSLAGDPADGVVCVLDADGSFDPAQLPRVADPVRAGAADLVARPAPARPAAAPGRRTPGWATPCSPGGCAAPPALPVHDLGPMRAARRADLLALDLRDRRFGYPLEMVVAAGPGRLADRPRSTSTTRPAPAGTRSKVTGTVRGTARAIRDMSAGAGPMTRRQLLVLAKAPVPGRVKTRLCPPCTPEQAAAVAAAALADTLDAGRRATPVADRVAGRRRRPPGAARLARGRRSAATGSASGWPTRSPTPRRPGTPSLLIGMDTPQVTAGAADRRPPAGWATADAVLGPAEDGGWWALGLRDPRHADGAARTYRCPRRTPARRPCAALRRRGLRVAPLPVLRDVDTAADAHAVAALCPAGSRFAAPSPQAVAAVTCRADGRAP